eukprot:14173806-Ditylum_brightwellii.AAC.1
MVVSRTLIRGYFGWPYLRFNGVLSLFIWWSAETVNQQLPLYEQPRDGFQSRYAAVLPSPTP